MEGIVKWFNRQKGYGFVKGDDEEDYFVHYRQVPQGVFLRENDRVSFDGADTERGKQAQNVQLLQGDAPAAPEEEPEAEAPEEESAEETPAEEPAEDPAEEAEAPEEEPAEETPAEEPAEDPAEETSEEPEAEAPAEEEKPDEEKPEA